MESVTIVAVTLPPTPAVVVRVPKVTVCPAFCVSVHKLPYPTMLNVSPTPAAGGKTKVTTPAPLAIYPFSLTSVVGLDAEVTTCHVKPLDITDIVIVFPEPEVVIPIPPRMLMVFKTGMALPESVTKVVGIDGVF